MGVIIEDIRYLDAFRPAETDVDWALYNIGEVANIEIDFRVEEVIVNDASNYVDGVNTVVLEPEPAETGIADREGLIWSNNPNAFENFYVGDTILVSGSKKNSGTNDGTHTITEKIDNSAIRVATAITPTFLEVGGYVQLTTPFRGLRYYWNFLENEAPTNFIDLVTGETQWATYDDIDNTDATAYNMVFQGLKDYQNGSITIEGNGISTYGQKFTLKQTVIFSPLYLESQYNDLIARIKPDYYLNDDCLKHIFRLEVNRDLSNPNDTISIDYDERLGNTGWFNENYNGTSTNYSFSNVVITRVSDSEALQELELANACDINFRVTNTTDSPFSAGNTKGIATFWQLPEEENYKNTGRTLPENFVYDYTNPQTEGAASIGGNFATAINEFEITYVDADNVDVRIRIDIGATSRGYINLNANKRYLVGFIVENHALTRETSDKVHLLINTNDFGLNLFQTDLISNATWFLQHRFSDVADGLGSVDVFPTDDVVAYNEFNIDFNGKTSDGINILNVTNQLVMTKTGEADIVLENNAYVTAANNFLSGYVPIIDLEQNREFRLTDGNFRKLVQIKRDEANDSGTIYAYKNIYPFFTRWETWEALAISNPPSGVYDSSLPNNGLNHYWHRYQTLGYELNHRIKFTVEQNGEQFEQEFDAPLITHPFDDNADWITESIKSYDVASGTELTSGGNKYIQGYANSKITASFTYNGSSAPAIADVDIVFWGIVKEQGNIKSVKRYSSVYTDNGDTFFTSTDGSGLVVKNKVVNLYTGEVLVDFSKLPNASEFTIYARLYDNPPYASAKLEEDGKIKTTESGSMKIIE